MNEMLIVFVNHRSHSGRQRGEASVGFMVVLFWYVSVSSLFICCHDDSILFCSRCHRETFTGTVNRLDELEMR